MINKIEEKLVKNTLTVVVTCEVRKMASHPIKVLTVEEIIDKINYKYKNIKLINSPSLPVGNTNRQKMSNVGTWIFEVEQEEEKIEKPKRSRKPATTEKSKQTTKTSIRGRISKLAKED